MMKNFSGIEQHFAVVRIRLGKILKKNDVESEVRNQREDSMPDFHFDVIAVYQKFLHPFVYFNHKRMPWWCLVLKSFYQGGDMTTETGGKMGLAI